MTDLPAVPPRFPLGQTQKQTLFKWDQSSTPGWSQGELGLKPPLNSGLCVDRDQLSHPPKMMLFPLFVLICEQIPLGRVPGRARICAGRDLHLGGGVVEMLLDAAGS